MELERKPCRMPGLNLGDNCDCFHCVEFRHDKQIFEMGKKEHPAELHPAHFCTKENCSRELKYYEKYAKPLEGTISQLEGELTNTTILLSDAEAHLETEVANKRHADEHIKKLEGEVQRLREANAKLIEEIGYWRDTYGIQEKEKEVQEVERGFWKREKMTEKEVAGP